MHILSGLKHTDCELIFNFLQDNDLTGIHKPSFYTVSSLIYLYGELGAVAYDNDKIIAASLNCPFLNERSAYIYTFAVKKSFQKKGIGRLLYKSILDNLRQRCYTKISLRVLKTNQTALLFWQAMGFSKITFLDLIIDEDFAEVYLEQFL
jgi:ribosomal protein S18 acetylase RimI-like enzyme